MTYEDLVRIAVETGTDGVEMTVYWLPSTSDDYLLPLRRLAYRNRVEIYGIGTRVRLAQPTADLRERQLTELRKWLDVAQKLGATHVRVFGGDKPDGATLDQAIGFAAETMKRGAELAGARGLILVLEDDGGITDFAKDTIEIVKRADSPWAAMNLDIGNLRPPAVYDQIDMRDPIRGHDPHQDRVDARRRQDARAVRLGSRVQDVRGAALSRLHGPGVRGLGRSGNRGARASAPPEGAGRQVLGVIPVRGIRGSGVRALTL